MSNPDHDNDDAKYAAMEAELSGGQPAEHVPHYGSDQPAVPQQEYHQPAPQMPDAHEDPIGHFSARASAVEQHLGQQQFFNAVQQSEKAMRDEFGAKEYDAACSHLENHRMRELAQMLPDRSQEAHIRARQAGFRTPAEYRQAILNHDRVAVATQAFQSGMSPAQLYYNLSLQRGYQSRAPLGKSQLQGLIDLPDDQFDKMWNKLAKAGRL